MKIKSYVLLITLFTPVVSFADLNKPYIISTGERLAACMESSIPLIDRTTIKELRSYTKYDKHYIALNSSSIYVDYVKKNSALNVVYVNNNHVETATSVENAKEILIDINASLIQPSIGYCSEMLSIADEIKLSMLYIDPPHESRSVKKVIKMDAEGNFSLP